MISPLPAHLVFVDFENVPTVDLASIADHAVLVSLLIGKGQKKLDLALVQQIHRYAEKVQLVEVGATGRNALDLTLAFYLGRAVEQNPAARFYIVSKDKDFDPLIAHLATRARVSRHDAFAALPFLPPPRKSSAASVKIEAADKLEKLIVHLRTKTSSRPTRRKTLQTHIKSVLGHVLSDEQVDQTIAELIAREVIEIDAKNRVIYDAAAST